MVPITETTRRLEIGISWRAIFLGLFVGLATQILLSLLGIAIGLTALDVTGQGNAGGVGIGAGIWAALVPIISWFFAAYVAAYSSGALHRASGVLHGLAVWAVGLIFTVWLFGMGLGGVLSGAAGLVGQGSQAAAQSGLVQRGEVQQQQQQLQQQVGQLGAQDAQQAADAAAGGAWGLFGAAFLSLLASLIGGAMGTRSLENRVVRKEEHRRVPPTTPPLTPRTNP